MLAAGTAVITGLGASLTPVYGNLSPYRESGVVDVRSAPHSTGWTTDLARSILPGVPVRCVSFTSSQSTDSLVLLTGASQPLGSSTGCSTLTSSQVRSTIALFDAATGRVLWTKNLGTLFSADAGTVTLQQSAIVSAAGRVVLQATVGGRYSVATLAIPTGRETGSVVQPPDQVGQSPVIAGTLLLYSGSTSREGSTEWTLVDVRRLGRPLWTAVLPDSDSPWLTRRAAFATIDGRSMRIDGRSGRMTEFGGGSVDLSNTLQDVDGLYTTHVVQAGTIVTAWDADGRRLWSRSGFGDLTGVSRDCVVVALPGTTKLTCLDHGDGRSRWTTDVGSLAYATFLPGQTSRDVPVYRSLGNRTEIVMIDGDTGKREYVLRLEPQTQVIAVSRTTGYLRTSSETGTATQLTAFDVHSGRTLWTRATGADGDTEFWGGHLVSVDAGQVARELGTRPPTILGD
ncbi:hypothetical protein GCM10025867_34610 [Frondihabitans sucicola]|uniref:Pyrrolo-quinoline quinone repeat domain-containing protein n=1 Tax=Frondihabitans sucicola TaxID=1268041 RepID=A0ABM8GSG3_9MICO|nr:hypothetical protein GCM10025867_34610 [Frondihabitans sucicola]